MDKLINIKVINLDRRPDRLEKFDSEMKKHSMDYERYSAVDGSSIQITHQILTMFMRNTFGWRRGIIGVALSHINLWKELIESDYEYYLIFEDDITLDDKFKIYYNSLLEELSKDTKIPFTFIGYHTDQEFLKNPFFIQEIENKTQLYPLKYKKHIWGGLFSYVIHRDFAKTMVDDIEKNSLKEPIDTYVLKYNDLYSSIPVFVYSQFMTFDNLVDSDIQYDLASAFDNYDFYSMMDSPGYDIRWVPNVKTFNDLKTAADRDPNCVAFNTYGFLKYKVDDPKKFIKLPGVKSRIHGIYVKRNYVVNEEYVKLKEKEEEENEKKKAEQNEKKKVEETKE